MCVWGVCAVVDIPEEDKELASGDWRPQGDIVSMFGENIKALYILKLLRYMETRGFAAAAGGSERLSFGVSLQHIYAYNPSLYFAITNAPQDATAAFDALLRSKFAELREMHGFFHTDTDKTAADELLLQQVCSYYSIYTYIHTYTYIYS